LRSESILDNWKGELDKLLPSSPKDDLLNLLIEAREDLNTVLTLLQKINETLVTGCTIGDTTLNTYRTNISTARTNVITAIQSITSLEQSVTSQKLTIQKIQRELARTNEIVIHNTFKTLLPQIIMNQLKRFWDFLKQDTWQSWLVFLILIVIFIRLIFFPTLSFITSTPLPLVVVESCSMYHSSSFDSWWTSTGEWYEENNIEKSEFENFPFKNGLNKGDIIFVWGRSSYKLGDVIIFQADTKNPIIHRVIVRSPIGTKGDNNLNQLSF